MANKLITELQLRSSFSATCNIPVDDTIQSYRVTGDQIHDFIKSFGAVESWSASVTYAADAFVVYSGYFYKSRQGTNLNQTPSATSAYWQRVGVEPTVDAASGASGVTLSATDEETQVFTPSGDITVKLDNSFKLGQAVEIINDGSALISLTANDNSVIATIFPDCVYRARAIAASPAVTASWRGLTPIITNPYTVTPTGSWTTNITHTGKVRRVGRYMHVQHMIAVTGSIGTPGNCTVTVPMSKTIDTAVLLSTSANRDTLDSFVTVDGNGARLFNGVMAYASTTTLQVYVLDDTTGGVDRGALAHATNNPFSFASNDKLVIRYAVPISGWSAFKG